MATLPLPPTQDTLPPADLNAPPPPPPADLLPPPPADFALPPEGAPPLPPSASFLPPSPIPTPSETTTTTTTTSIPLPPAPLPDLAPPPPEIPPPPAPAAAVPPKGSPLRSLAPFIIGGLILALLGILFATVILPILRSSRTPKEPPTITIRYQGLWESPEIMQPVLDQFQSQNPGIKVDYQMQSHVDYRERLQTTLASTSPPDVVRFHSTWLPMLLSNLQPAPAAVLTPAEIQSNFYPAVSDAILVGSQVYAAPTTFEGLALFVNQSMLDTVGAQPPRNWADLRTLARTLTQKDPTTGAITQAGAALGTTNNVDHWPDIVSLMALQNGANLRQPDTRLFEALQFYTLFTTADQTWDSTMPPSVQAFAAGRVAMILAPSWRVLEIRALNPSLSWQILPVPQLPETTPTTWANFWVEGVPKNAPSPDAAWKLVKFLASSEAQQLLYDSATKARGYAQAPANKALATTLADSPIIGPYLQQSSTAKTFFTTSLTHDGPTGINSRLIKYLEDAVNALVAGRNQDNVLPPLQQGFQQVLSQYGLVAPAPTP